MDEPIPPSSTALSEKKKSRARGEAMEAISTFALSDSSSPTHLRTRERRASTSLPLSVTRFEYCHKPWPTAPGPARLRSERAALMAALTRILCASFNARIEMSLPRDAPAYIYHRLCCTACTSRDAATVGGAHSPSGSTYISCPRTNPELSDVL
ncbi:hypothetical protein FB451DRAFT_1278843, partial [Mycena latifolia]